ncbi:MAG: N-acetylglucosamine-6-sulfatase [Solirubrobacterales bacterium]|nr:N-acetylglucosamine-6-sulfatase [Solirubrobacterales bacterium]
MHLHGPSANPSKLCSVSGNLSGGVVPLRARRWSLAALVAAGAALFAAVVVSEPSAADGSASGRPNVVVIMTDDQNVSDLAVMPKTRRLLADQGARFDRYYVSDPLCCPSRATFLTGQYAHNHGVLQDGGKRGGYQRLRKRQTLNVWLHKAGYRTAQIGKFLNHYGEKGSPREIPPGWDEWDVPPGVSRQKLYDYVLNQNGRLRHYGHRPADYQTDVYAKLAAAYIGRQRASRPFFLSLMPVAPHDDAGGEQRMDGLHGPPPAPRHKGRFRDLPFPETPSFNEADVSDKPAYVQDRHKLTKSQVKLIKRGFRRRSESLLAVDDLVGRVVKKLSARGLLENTYVVFTSDNGFLLGEHRLQAKSLPYEESVRVPFLLRGPGVPEGVVRQQLTANVDLAATIVGIAGAESRVSHPLDGVSLLPFATADAASTRPILLESFEHRRFIAVESGDWVYVKYPTGDRELYDLANDPFELGNLAADPAASAKRSELEDLLQALRDCGGASCSG